MSRTLSTVSRRTAIVTTCALMFAAALPRAGSAQDSGEGNSMTVEGVLAYLGVLPAAIVRGHPESHGEGSMHGGAPEGRHRYHLVVAIFDAQSGKRIESAQVSVKIMGLGHEGATRLDLDPMAIANSITWGTYVNLPGSDVYDLTFEVKLPGRTATITFPFRYAHSDH